MLLVNNKIKKSLDLIQKAFEQNKDWYISLSFGKDSLATAYLVNEIQKTKCCFLKSWETFLLYKNYKEIVEHYSNIFDVQIIKSSQLEDSKFDWNSYLEKHLSGDDQDFKQKELKKHNGYFCGLRTEESKKRKMSILSDKPVTGLRKYKNGKWRCSPVWFWTDAEIRYFLRDKPLLSGYKNENDRTSSWAIDFQKCGTLQQLKRDNYNGWQELVKKIPELK